VLSHAAERLSEQDIDARIAALSRIAALAQLRTFQNEENRSRTNAPSAASVATTRWWLMADCRCDRLLLTTRSGTSRLDEWP
jgi:hypothetical protein